MSCKILELDLLIGAEITDSWDNPLGMIIGYQTKNDGRSCHVLYMGEEGDIEDKNLDDIRIAKKSRDRIKKNAIEMAKKIKNRFGMMDVS